MLRRCHPQKRLEAVAGGGRRAKHRRRQRRQSDPLRVVDTERRLKSVPPKAQEEKVLGGRQRRLLPVDDEADVLEKLQGDVKIRQTLLDEPTTRMSSR